MKLGGVMIEILGTLAAILGTLAAILGTLTANLGNLTAIIGSRTAILGARTRTASIGTRTRCDHPTCIEEQRLPERGRVLQRERDVHHLQRHKQHLPLLNGTPPAATSLSTHRSPMGVLRASYSGSAMPRGAAVFV
jgi:hypothetical protein